MFPWCIATCLNLIVHIFKGVINFISVEIEFFGRLVRWIESAVVLSCNGQELRECQSNLANLRVHNASRCRNKRIFAFRGLWNPDLINLPFDEIFSSSSELKKNMCATTKTQLSVFLQIDQGFKEFQRQLGPCDTLENTKIVKNPETVSCNHWRALAILTFSWCSVRSRSSSPLPMVSWYCPVPSWRFQLV